MKMNTNSIEEKPLIPAEPVNEINGVALPKEVQNALEMMKRIKTVDNVRDANSIGTQGTVSYLLPQPIYLCPTTV
jgi:hypothetical protein